MKLEHIILGLLQLKSQTGYDIKKYLDTEGRFLREPVHYSQLYRTLKSMEQDGWVSFVEEEREGRPDAKIYNITPLGNEVFLNWLRSPLTSTFRFQESDLSVRLSFGSMLDNATLLRLLHNELDIRKEQIRTRRHRDRRIAGLNESAGVDPERVRFLQDLTHEHGNETMDHYIDWLERAITKIERELPDLNAADRDRVLLGSSAE